MRRLIFIMMAVLACTFGITAQTRTYSGTVLDATTNEPLIGVTVAPIGGGQATPTDVDGKFTLRVPQNVTKARFTYVGYNPATVDLRADMKVYLQSTDAQLDEMVVVAYGTASKESLTGSVAVVNEKEIEKRPVSSVTQALEGMSPGVQVNNSTGTPGSSPSIIIRGINTISGSTAPLYVVDGSIFNGSISDLNPNDVENISVLKDAASCALYGSKGANGVVMITTKRAKGAGKCDITLKIRQGAYTRALPQYERLGYDQWNETMLKAIANGNYSAAYGGSAPLSREDAFTNAVNSFFSDAGVLNLYGQRDNEGKLVGDIEAGGKDVFDADGRIIAEMMPGYTDLDWWDAIGRNGYRQEYNVSATGATDKFNVFGSVGYLSENGYIQNNDFSRWNARLRGDFQPVKYLKFGVNLGATVRQSANPQFDSDNLSSTSNPFAYQTTAPGLPYYEHNWDTGQIIYDEFTGQPVWNTMAGYSAFTSNKGYILRANSDNSSRIAIDATTYGTIILPYGFDFTVRGSMNRWREENTGYDSPIIGSAQGFGRLTKYWYKNNTYNFQQTLNWSKEYGMHHVDVMLNHENYNRTYDYSTAKNRNQLFPDKLFLSNFTDNESTGAYAFQYRTESYMGRARYNYNQQYYLELSLNRDGSSRFSKEKRWGTFWSVGASWILTKEKFMQDLTWVDFLKLRLSYGTAGNDYTSGYYPYMNAWSKYSHTLGGYPSIFPGTVGNPDLSWEKTATLDAALEANLFNNRLNLSVGYFLKRNNDLIYSVSQTPSNGTTSVGGYVTIDKNVGDMHNWGWEIAVGGTLIRTRDWTWDMSVDATFITNKVDKLPAGNIYGSPRSLVEGKSRYEWCMPVWAGVDMMTGRSLYEVNKESYKFETEAFDDKGNSLGYQFDQDKWDSNLANAAGDDALIQIGDRYYTTKTSYASNDFCGTSLPTVTGSFGTNLRWRDLSLGMLFTYALGGKTLDSTYTTLMSTTAGSALHKDVLNSWTLDMAKGIEEDSPNRINPNINPELNTYYTNDNNGGTTTRWLTSNNYLALKNLNINYDLPNSWMQALKMKGISLGFSIDNVFIATKRKGMNPRYNNAGAQGNYFVASRVYAFELTARF